MIGQFCTSDIDNYGDLLYHVIFKKLVERQGYNQNIAAYGFLEGQAPCGAGYYVNDINKVLRYGKEKLTHLVVGGGDIFRADTLMLASHYAAIEADRNTPSLTQKITSKMKKTLFGISEDPNKIFIEKYINYGAAAPFIINRNNYRDIGSLIYFSIGVPFGFDLDQRKAVKESIESADYVYLRDEQSKNKLVDAGVTKHLHVAPDAIVVLSDFFDKVTEIENGKKIIAEHGLPVDKEYICVQSIYQQPQAEEELVKALLDINAITSKNIFLMPIGFCHNDDIYLKRIADKTKGVCKYVEPKSIFDMISLIAASSLFIGTSMHGNITAFSFGIPHLFGPIAIDKAEGFLDIVGLGRESKLAAWSDSAQRITQLENQSTDHLELLVSKAKGAVYDTFAQMYSIISEPRA